MANGKTALVTGANKGIGREIARRFAELGYSVWLGCRATDRGEEAVAAVRTEGGDVRFLQLDVVASDSVARAAAALRRETDRLDVLVNNAGIALGAGVAPSALDVALMQATYEVNVFGPVRVTQAFLPLLRAAPAGRIVMMSSGLGSLGRTSVFAKELRDTPIKVNAADPGYTATDLNGHRGPRTVAQGAEIAVRLATLADDGPTGGFFNDEGAQPW